FLLVWFAPDALDQTDAEIERGDEVASRRCLLEPAHNPNGIVRSACALLHEIGEIHLCRLITGFARDAQPACGLSVVACYAGAGEIEGTQRPRSGLLSCLGRPPIPRCRLDIIRRQWARLSIEVANESCGSRIAGQRCPPQP